MGRSTKGVLGNIDDDDDDDDADDDDDDDDVVTFNAQVAKLCLQDESHDPWTCAFFPTKHSVF